ncbi:hypothetical protein ACFQI3_02035 [Hansschlegelia quercus]|uniref:Uncharacterized protein n=1 Tax=Hansschlegelia quercus TaxID=2528245 RepID=A0A4Q9GSE1_9HYPH|nr:hypothetical protein [Hansschlegelia quercus]TBN54717.1 hypothetical protein EYR15_00675 [Hansschlegelia quercus]
MFTLDEYLAVARQNTPLRIASDMAFAPDHETRLRLVEEAIDWISQDFTKNKHLKQDSSEDDLTVQIVLALKAMNFLAYHDVQYGGHTDIIVEGANEFLWIAEAKIHKDYNWLLDGFEQLDRRYSTGLPGQNAGELIVYVKVADANAVMERWSKHLANKRSDVSIVQCGKDPLARRSEHIHASTGLSFYVRHKPFVLYHKPTV